MTLTLKRIKGLSPGRYTDQPTLSLMVAPGGSKSWTQRLTINGRRVDRGLGGFPLVSIDEAREIAFDNRRKARKGIDPFATSDSRASVPSFAEAAASTLEANRERWADSTLKHWLRPLELHVFPTIGKMRVSKVTRQDVLSVLTPIWNDKPAEARKCRKRISTVLKWAVAHGHCETNVAENGQIDGALPTKRREVAHHAALPFADVPAAFATIPDDVTGDCLRFLILTGARSNEARGATWSEIATDAREWRVPAERMKSRREHRVPLTDAAVAILERHRGDSDVVFASPRTGRALSDMAFSRVTGKLGTTVHGFRSAFRDWAAESKAKYEHAVIEMSLAHAPGTATERAYHRSDLFDKRRALMTDWAEFVTMK